jgi:hypothetical protein
MYQACRPTGRLFYWVLAVLVVTASSALVWAREGTSAGKPASSPTAKLRAAEVLPRAASPTPQSGPALTSVIDTVYMASGSPAQGVLVITWPAFVTSTTVSVDAGMAPLSGGGIEVRENNFGWGQANDRNLLGRFNTQTFSLPRLARTQNYFLRLYDGSSPPKYSRYSAALHVDYPL